jgi:hypothetical protein
MTADGWYWLSSERMTVGVLVIDTRVASGPPIVRRFVGGPALDLIRWLARQGGLRSAFIGR